MAVGIAFPTLAQIRGRDRATGSGPPFDSASITERLRSE